MSEKERTPMTRPRRGGNNEGESGGSGELTEIRELAERMRDRAQRSLDQLGLSNSEDFLSATRQSGGQ